MNELRQEKTYGYRAPFNMTAEENDGLLYEYPAVPKGDAEDYNKKAAEARANGYKTTDQAIADQQAINRKLAAKEKGYTEINVKTTKDLIISKLSNELYDTIFQAVNDEMTKHEVFQEETYFTPQGFEEFQDTWFEFYHDHFGEIMHDIFKSFTN